ncbi:MAG: C25 family cysteine peptidase [Candidatus Eisenbacteria bacterium]|nr:C25 family cysteine peptidase [Candidatus Eisenbacteria bacterium]
MRAITVIRLTLMLLCLASMAGTAAAAGSTPEITLSQTITISPREVRILRHDGVDFITLAGGATVVDNGQIDLPAKPLTFRLPEDMLIAAVAVRVLETEALRGSFNPARVRTASSDGTMSPLGAPAALELDAEGYHPATMAEPGAHGRMRGRSLGGVIYTPFRFRQADGRLEIITRAELVLTLVPSARDRANDFLPLRREPWADAIVDRQLAGLIVNPTIESDGRQIGAELQPLLNSGAPFAPTFRPSVNGSPVAMVIITNEAQVAQYQRLADWKTRSGIPTVVRTVNWIKVNYPNGVDTQDTIRNFVRDAAQKWGTVWLLLGGDTDVIPTRYGKTAFFNGEEIPTDLYYQCVDGTWNGDGDNEFGEGFSTPTQPGDSADLYPEVWIGRTSTVSVAQATAVVNKILAYESTPLRNGYQDDYLGLAEVLFPQTWNPGDQILFDGASIAEEGISHLPPNYSLTKLYENCPNANWPTCIVEEKSTVLDSLDAGFGLVHHLGHGFINTMAVGRGDQALTNADADACSNGDETFVLYAINCTSSAIDFNCIAERYLLNPNGGTVASIGSTRFDFPSTGWSYQTEFFRLVFEQGVHELGQAASACKLPFIPLSLQDNTHRWTQFTQIYFGDPAMTIYTMPPADLAVSHPATQALGAATFTVTVNSGGNPLGSARVCLHKPNDEYVVGLTDALGQVILPFVPDSTGTAQLTVVADNHVPYLTNITVTAPAAPYLYAADQLIVDNGTGASVGNSDGRIDAGETIQLSLPVRNRGGALATGVSATVVSLSAFVTVVDGVSSYPSVASGAQVNPGDPLVLAFGRTAPDRTEPVIQVTWQSSAGTIVEEVVLYVHAPVFQWFRQFPRDTTGNGNGNSVFAPNEDVTLRVELRNAGLGQARNVTAILRSTDPAIVISDSTVTFGTMTGGSLAISRPSDTFRFQMSDTTGLGSNGKKLRVSLYDLYSPLTALGSFLIDARTPTGTMAGLTARGAESSISLLFVRSTTIDLLGYNIYRSATSGGSYSRINQNTTIRTAYYNDEGLPALTAFFYKVAAQDSSGNEGPLSTVFSASTTLPLHDQFPVELESATNASVTLADLDYDGDLEILAGAGEVYAIQPDGTEVFDGDGDIRTLGVLTNTTKPGYWNAPAVGDVDLDGSPEVAAVSWLANLYLWNEFGQIESGWPRNLNVQSLVDPNPLSSVAMGDVDGDGDLELFVMCGRVLFGFHHTGAEIVDGDANPATIGVIKIINTAYCYGTPALADMNGDGRPEVIVGMRDRKLHVFNPVNWTELPGFPYTTLGEITSSPAVGDIDNDGQPEIIFGASDSKVYALNGDGTAATGWPQGIQLNEDFDSSPAIGDLTGDGIPDVVTGASNGVVFAWRNNGTLLPGWPVLIKDALGANVAVRSSPILVDVDANGIPEVLFGDQIGRLHGYYANGTRLPGFPIQTGNLIEGGPAAWDLDGDGLTEIVAESFDQKVYVWDTPWTFNALASPWPMFHHDPRHTGLLTSPIFYQTGVPESPVPGLKPFHLAQNRPNPFNPVTAIDWRIERALRGGDLLPVRLEVFSPTGRLVRVLVDRPMPVGDYQVLWDGTDQEGRAVSSGVYYYRLLSPDAVESRKMVLVR